jgi:anti-sigma B factor antagonist
LSFKLPLQAPQETRALTRTTFHTKSSGGQAMSLQRVYGGPATVALERRQESGTSVVKVRGEIDLQIEKQLREVLINEINHGWNLIVDLSQVDFFDSTAAGLLVGVLKRARERDQRLGLEQTQLVLVVDTPAVRRTLAIIGLDRVFTITDRLEDAESLS